MITTSELRRLIREALDDHEGNRDEQVLTVTAILARVIEETCRPHPWPPPRRLRVDEGAAKRQQRQETRESA